MDERKERAHFYSISFGLSPHLQKKGANRYGKTPDTQLEARTRTTARAEIQSGRKREGHVGMMTTVPKGHQKNVVKAVKAQKKRRKSEKPRRLATIKGNKI